MTIYNRVVNIIKSHMKKPNSIHVILLLAFLIRILVVWISPGAEYDIDSYRLVGSAVLEGRNPYVEFPGRYPYFPGWAVFEATAVYISRHSSISAKFIIGLALAFIDTLVCMSIYQILKGGKAPSTYGPFTGAIFHAINPAAILVVSGHIQFDVIPILSVIIALHLVQSSSWNKAAISLGIGISIKTVGLLFGPLLLAYRSRADGYRETLRTFLITAIPSGIISIPFLIRSPKELIKNVLGYSSSPLVGWHPPVDLVSKLLSFELPILTQEFLTLTKFLLILTILSYCVFISRSDNDISVYEGASTIILMFYVISSGLAPQYIYWLTPFLPLISISNFHRVSYVISSTLAATSWYVITYAIELVPPIGHLSGRFLAFGVYGFLNMIFWTVCLHLLYSILKEYLGRNSNI